MSSTYAVIESGSKQYVVEPKATIEVEKLKLSPNQKEVLLEKVLLVKTQDKIQVGNPWVKGAKVVCDFLGETRAKKVISFKYRRRKASRKKIGHRQNYFRLFVKEIKLS